MKISSFLYNFAKIYIPAALLLVVAYMVMQYISTNYPEGFNLSSLPALQKKLQSPQQSPATAIYENPVTPQSPVQQSPPPRYSYMIELSSGGSMNAESVAVQGNMVTIFVEDGYELRLPKSDIKRILKIKAH